MICFLWTEAGCKQETERLNVFSKSQRFTVDHSNNITAKTKKNKHRSSDKQ